VHVRAGNADIVQAMLTAERKEHLLDQLARAGRLVAKDAAQDAGTSADTIRRDLRELAAEGRLQRVHGGALPASPAVAALPVRSTINTAAKAAVAAAAARLVEPGRTIFVDGGTTAALLVRAIDPTIALTVVTHSPTTAIALADHPLIEVLMIGGTLFRHSMVACGTIAAETAQSIRADAFFMGVTGVHPDAGLTTGDAEEAAMKRLLASRAAATYVLASAEKVGTASAHRVVPWSRITAVITDRSAPSRTLGALRRRGVDVRVAPPVIAP
jgi:DeoR/GlpR family transcriptional regulator of sugar metabolism